MSDTKKPLQAPEIDLLGYDPYDGLNSPLFNSPRLSGSRLLKMAWIQLCKRSPINLRPLLGIPRVANPKGLALLILSHETRLNGGMEGLAPLVLEEVESRLWAMKDKQYGAWGYGFPWQNRSFFFPRGLSNTVVSSFVGRALLHRWLRTGNAIYLNHAEDIVHFFLHDLWRSQMEEGICLSYSALDRSQIINTSLLAAQFLCAFSHVKKHEQIDLLVPKLLQFALLTQKSDGSWPYGLAPNQKWIDSFHSGYNLCALHACMAEYPGEGLELALQKGCSFYENHFFGKNGEAFYYADQSGPVDIHSIAQAIITLKQLDRYFDNGKRLKDRVISWAMDHMWDEHRKTYAFQRHRYWTNRINYNRWSQAWMHYAHAVETSHAH